MKTLLPFLLLGLLAVSAKTAEPKDQLPQAPEGTTWKLVWHDEIGKWGGDITKAKLPDWFLVDYVRVYDLMDDK